MKATVTRHDLLLRNPFGISRGTTSVIPTLRVATDDGALGEGSPVRYRGESADQGAALARAFLDALPADFPPDDPAAFNARLREAAPGHASARAALDIAYHDRLARALGVPLHQLLALPRCEGAHSTFTIALDSDERMAAKAREAHAFPLLNVKLGRDDAAVDEATLRAVRDAAPGKVLRVDANAGWSLPTARRMAVVCADLGVEFLEQPLTIGNLDQLAELRATSPLPVIADEDAQDAASLPALVGRVDGINIKLMKCGGVWEACRMLAFARDQGWRVMLGCMIETSIGIAAAAHLAGAVDCFDLDAEWLITDNPFPVPVLGADGSLWTPTGPGLGLPPIGG
jgi:L-alanine-DL-glutamate epimerase-like enolase superfamily enzyme